MYLSNTVGDTDTKLNLEAVVGGVIGGVAAFIIFIIIIIVIIILLCCCFSRKKKGKISLEITCVCTSLLLRTYMCAQETLLQTYHQQPGAYSYVCYTYLISCYHL